MLYKELAETYEKLEATTLKLKKTSILAGFFENADVKEIAHLTLLLQGTVFPSWSQKEMGIASLLMIKTIMQAYGASEKTVKEQWTKLGDLGLVSEKLAESKKQSTLFKKALTSEHVFEVLRKLSTLEGKGSQEKKIMFLSELLSSAKAREAKYITRTVLGELRVGVAEGLLRDAIAEAFFTNIYWKELLWQGQKGKKRIDLFLENTKDKKIIIGENFEKLISSHSVYKKFKLSNAIQIKNENEIRQIKSFWKKKTKIDLILVANAELGSNIKKNIIETIENAHNITNDYAQVAEVIAASGEEGLKKVSLQVLRPIKVMRYQKAKDIEDAFSIVGEPAAFEYKYDGFRLQIHKKGNEIKLFTRRLEDVSRQFPDVVEAIKKGVNSDEFILDAEVMGLDLKTKRELPFQKISQRIKRKYDIKEMVAKIPVVVNIFDAIQINNKNLLKAPFDERRAKAAKIVNNIADKLKMATQIVTADRQKAERFYKESLEKGNEGVMVKNLKAPYKPGSRVGYGVKVKPIMETLDLVIIGAEYGEGKRSGWFSSFELACIDSATGEYLPIGKMGTGIKEKAEEGVSFEQLTKIIKPLIVEEKGKQVSIKPSIVVEVAYEEIQKSTTYSSGYALRFPRLVKLRDDLKADEANDLDKVERLYEDQRGRKETIRAKQ